LLDSVAPLVNMTSDGLAPKHLATVLRDSSKYLRV
jgi:hypothetical protein